MGYIAVDLDGTLAEYSHWHSPEHIGAPIPKMIERVKRWLEKGKDVRIFTARHFPLGLNYAELIGPDKEFATWEELMQRVLEAKIADEAIDNWGICQFGKTLPITCTKNFKMYEQWDDRAIQVIPNTGERADGKER